MRVKLTSILTTIIVNSVLTSARSHRMTEDRLVFQQLFDSIAKNDENKNEAYREIVRRDIEDDKQAFEAVKGQLTMSKRGNIHTRRNSHEKINIARVHSTQVKREIEMQGRQVGEMNNMMRLPVAGDNFETCVHNNKIIVDKTPLIKKLLTTKRGINLITRPSGFGKSFFINMLECFFLNKKHLFKNTSLYYETIPEYPWREYAVVKINFAAFDGLRPETFERQLHKKLIQISDEYHVEPKDRSCSIESNCILYEMDNLFDRLQRKGHRILLLIDDYDSPYMHSVLAQNGNADGIRRILWDFYSVFEYDASGDGRIEFGLITGRYGRPPGLVANFMGSGPMDNIHDLSSEPEFHDLIGFTKSEIDQYYTDVLHQSIETRRRISTKTQIDTLMNELHHNLTSWYNDYRFISNEIKLYSALSVVEFLNELPSEMKTSWAKTVLDSHLMIAAMKLYPVEMIRLVLDAEWPRALRYDRLDLSSSVEYLGKRERPGLLRPLYAENLLEGTRSSFDEVIKLLYQEGYVTIKEYRDTDPLLGGYFELKCTNKERSASLWETLRRTLLTGGENWLKVLEQKDYESFFSQMENCITRHYKELREYDTLVSFCLSNGDLNEMIERVHTNSEKKWSHSEWSQYVLENSQSVFIVEYKIETSTVKGNKSWTELCKDEYRRNYLDKGKRVLFCIAILFGEHEVPAKLPRKNAKPSKGGRIVNCSVRGFAENGSVIEERNHPSNS